MIVENSKFRNIIYSKVTVEAEMEVKNSVRLCKFSSWSFITGLCYISEAKFLNWCCMFLSVISKLSVRGERSPLGSHRRLVLLHVVIRICKLLIISHSNFLDSGFAV